MKKTRIIAILMALALAFLVFAACANDTMASNDPTITAPTTPTPTMFDERLEDSANFPVVTITMEDGGVIQAVLFPDRAPNTVANFLSLVNAGFYDGLVFHRVVPGFMIQGGCPLGQGIGGAGYNIPCETRDAGFAPNNISHVPGVLSMAHAGQNTGSSQFFIMHGAQLGLDGRHTGFGMVISGMDVVDQIVNVPTEGEAAIDPPVIATITAETRGIQFPEPTTLPRG